MIARETHPIVLHSCDGEAWWDAYRDLQAAEARLADVLAAYRAAGWTVTSTAVRGTTVHTVRKGEDWWDVEVEECGARVGECECLFVGDDHEGAPYPAMSPIPPVEAATTTTPEA